MTTISQQQNPDDLTICLEPDQLLDLIENGEENERALEHIRNCSACTVRFATLLETWVLSQQARVQVSAVDPAFLKNQVGGKTVIRQGKARRFAEVLRSWLIPPRLLVAGAVASVILVAIVSVAFLQGRIARPETLRVQMQAQLEQARRSETRARQELASAKQQIQTQDVQKHDQAGRFAQQEQDIRNRLTLVQGTVQAHQRRESFLNRQIAQLRQSRATSANNLSSPVQKIIQQLADANEDLSRGVVMGGSETTGADIELYTPISVIIPGRRVTFRWQAESDGATYVVHIQTPRGDTINSPPQTTARWSCELPPNTQSGSLYIWNVTTSDHKQSPGARFIVLDTSHLRAGK